MRKKIFSFKVFLTGIILLGFFLINSSLVLADEWTQHAHDGQRTGYSSEEPKEPWTFKWHWQPDGGISSTQPHAPHPVTGGSYIYMPYGNQGLYAIRKSNGTTAWKQQAASFEAAPAYDPSTGYLYAGGADGKLYKLNPDANGNIIDIYNTGSGLNREVLLVNQYAYLVTDNGELHKVDTNNMSLVWKYSAGSGGTTGAVYSASRNILIYGTKDLNVHAVNNSNGSLKWKKKPTSLTPSSDGCGRTFEYGWPVVADAQGVVLIRMRLGELGSWLGNKFPTTNSEIKSRLQSNPEQRPLFALDLETGEHRFTPAVGNGGVDCQCGGLVATIGPMPVVKTLSNGRQVAYIIWRNGDTTETWDGRWDAHMGEMVLDNNTVSGYTAGDLRFVKFQSWISDGMITDEMGFMSVAGNTIFHAHWGQSEAYTILDRSDNKGNTRANPITTKRKPLVVRRLKSGAGENLAKRTFTGGSNLYCDTRWCQGPGFWVYLDEVDPPTPDCKGNPRGYGSCILRRYTFVSDGMIYVVGNGGDIFALSHSGSSGPAPSPSPTPTPDPIADILTILVNWGNNGGDGDVNSDGKVNGVDFAQVIKEISN